MQNIKRSRNWEIRYGKHDFAYFVFKMGFRKYILYCNSPRLTVYPKKYAHGFCFAVLCYGYTLTAFPISIRLTSLALWQSNDCPSASRATLMNMDKYFMWIHYERLHNHNKAKHNKTVCIFLGIYCTRFEDEHLSYSMTGNRLQSTRCYLGTCNLQARLLIRSLNIHNHVICSHVAA